jgi:Ca2+-binding EF-hand superfamily protein
MSSISSVNGSGSGFSMMPSMKRPDQSKIADDLFSKLDTTNKGYLDKSDLQSALSQLSGSDTSSSNSSTTVDEMFKKLDSNSDDKITKDEMSSGMKKLTEALDSQMNQMRMNGNSGKGSGGTPPSGGMPPPPPPSGSGNTKSTASASSESSTQSSSTTKIYDPADTNQDGKVSRQETLAYELKAENSASTSSKSSDSNAASSTSTGSDAKVMKQIMELVHAYGSFDSSTNNSELSVTA